MAWPSVRIPRAAMRSASSARVRALVCQRALDDPHRALGVLEAHALLAQAPRVGGHAPRRREREQPRVVLGAHEVQGPAAQPRDDERPVVGQRGVDVCGADPRRPRAQRQPRGAQVLRLHGEQLLDDRGRPHRRGALQQLRRGTGPAQRGHAGRSPRTSASTWAAVISGVTRIRGSA